MFGLAALVGDIFRAKIEEAYQKRRPGDGPCNSSMAYLASDSVPCVDGGTRDDDTRYCVVECRRGSEWSCPANNSYRWWAARFRRTAGRGRGAMCSGDGWR